MEQLTIKQALEQGYTKCANRNDEWCSVHDISDLIAEDFTHDTWWLASKKSKNYNISDQYLSNLLAEQIAEDEYEETGRDDNEIHDAIASLDFKPFTEMINNKLNEFDYYRITQIQLIQ